MPPYEQKQNAQPYDDAWPLAPMRQPSQQHGDAGDLYAFYGLVTSFDGGCCYGACGQENGESVIYDPFYGNGSSFGDVCCENDDAFSNGPFLFLFL